MERDAERASSAPTYLYSTQFFGRVTCFFSVSVKLFLSGGRGDLNVNGGFDSGINWGGSKETAGSLFSRDTLTGLCLFDGAQPEKRGKWKRSSEVEPDFKVAALWFPWSNDQIRGWETKVVKSSHVMVIGLSDTLKTQSKILCTSTCLKYSEQLEQARRNIRGIN